MSPFKPGIGFYNPENTRALNTGKWCPLAPRTAGRFPSCLLTGMVAAIPHLFLNSLNIFWQPLMTWYLITQMKYCFLPTSRYRDKAWFPQDGETVLSLSMRSDPCGNPNTGISDLTECLIRIYCALHSICWVRQHLVVWLAVTHTGLTSPVATPGRCWQSPGDNLRSYPWAQHRLKVRPQLQTWGLHQRSLPLFTCQKYSYL